MNKTIRTQFHEAKTNGDQSVSSQVARLTREDYVDLVAFARFRISRVITSKHLQERILFTDPEDLVHDAILKLLIGEQCSQVGRHVSTRHLATSAVFLTVIKGIINSDLSHLVRGCARLPEHLPIGYDDEPEAGESRSNGYSEPASRECLEESLMHRDLKRSLFRELYRRIEKKPALNRVVNDWESRFLTDFKIGSNTHDAIAAFRVRKLAREIVVRLEPEIVPKAA